MPARQERAPNLITDGCESPCGCWELNLGPLEGQPVLLTSEPPLQPSSLLFYQAQSVGEGSNYVVLGKDLWLFEFSSHTMSS